MSYDLTDVVQAIKDSTLTQTLVDNEGKTVFNKPVYREQDDWRPPAALEVRTLTAVADYVNTVEEKSKVLIHVASPTTVDVYTYLDKRNHREKLVACNYFRPPALTGFLSQDGVVEYLHTMFERKGDWEMVAKFVSGLQAESSTRLDDDGVSQTTSVKKSIASNSFEKVPSPCTLYPYWTFPEIDAPEVKFTLRLRREENNIPTVKLVEYGNGAWAADCIGRIALHLGESLEDDSIPILA